MMKQTAIGQPEPNRQPPSSELGLFLELGWKYARDVMLMTDCQTGAIVDANPEAARITGYSCAELAGMDQSCLYADGEHDLASGAFQTAYATPGAIVEFHLRCKNGLLIPIELTTSPPIDAGGRRMVICLFRDISKAKENKRRLTIHAWALKAYAGAAMALAHSHSSTKLMQEICDAITRESPFVLAWVGFAENDPAKSVRIAGAAGPALRYLDGIQISWDENLPSGQGPTGIALRTGKAYVMEDSEASDAFATWRSRARLAGVRSSIATPFQVEDGPRGALMVYSPRPHSFNPVEAEAFTHLAEEIGIGLHARLQAERLEAERMQREQAQRELSDALAAVVGAVTTAMEMRDPYTAGHQRRVADLAAAIAGELQWPQDRIEGLRVAALVHDIGKIAIPSRILTKPLALSQPELTLIRQHPEIGYAILKDIPFKWPIAEAVRQHHERLDGSGYPRGLSGNAILPGARILAVADIVDALASTRPYRPAIPMDGVLHQIGEMAGILLDEAVVRVCTVLFREKGFVFRAPSPVELSPLAAISSRQ